MTHTTIKQEGNRKAYTVLELILDRNDPALNATFALETESLDTPRTTNNPLAYTGNHFRTYRYTDQQVFGMDHFPNLMTAKSKNPKIDPGKTIGDRARATCTVKDFITNDLFELSDDYQDRAVTGSHFLKLLARNFYKNRKARILRCYGPSDFDSFDCRIENYLIDHISQPTEDGTVTISLIDELILTEREKAKAPLVNTGELNGSLSNSALTLTFSSTVTDEYGAVSSTGYIIINKEIMAFTVATSTTMTITRAQFGTSPAFHSDAASIQQCIYYNNVNVMFILEDLITNYTQINTDYIPVADWLALEVGDLVNYNLTRLITKPQDVKKLFNELIQITGISMYVDVIDEEIVIKTVPRFLQPVIEYDEFTHLTRAQIKSNPSYKDQVTRQSIRWGKNNYAESDSVDNYSKNYQEISLTVESPADEWNTSEPKELRTDWLRNHADDNLLALNYVSLNIQRFSRVPNLVRFHVDERWVGEVDGGEMWLGSVFQITTNKLVDGFLNPLPTAAQCISISTAAKDGQYEVVGLTYAAEVAPGEDFILISTHRNNADLRAIYDASAFPAPDASTVIRFIVDFNVQVGSTSSGTNAMTTGSWPAGATVILALNTGAFVVGHGGNGANAGAAPSAATIGGPALLLEHDLTIDNSGTVGSGGGGGGTSEVLGDQGGGGGAGRHAGIGGEDDGPPGTSFAQDGTIDTGGKSNFSIAAGGSNTDGDGGNLGEDGHDGFGIDANKAGAAAGLFAIDKNGFTLTEDKLGTVEGIVLV